MLKKNIYIYFFCTATPSSSFTGPTGPLAYLDHLAGGGGLVEVADTVVQWYGDVDPRAQHPLWDQGCTQRRLMKPDED